MSIGSLLGSVLASKKDIQENITPVPTWTLPCLDVTLGTAFIFQDHEGCQLMAKAACCDW